MLEEETATLLVWINQFDAFVQMNDAAAKIWHGSMYQISYAEAEEAVIQHYRQNPGKQAEPGAVLKRALNMRASAQAKQQALTAGPSGPEKTSKDYEKRTQSPAFKAAFQEGVRQGNEMRARATAARQVS